MIMNSQHFPMNGEPSYGTGTNMPYGQTAPYGMNAAYGQNLPYGQNAPYGMNEAYGQAAPYGVNGAYGQNMPYTQNVSYEQNALHGQAAPYGVNGAYGQNMPYTQNVSYEQNALHGQAAPYGMNVPYEADFLQEGNMLYGYNTPLQNMNPAYGANQLTGINQPVYAMNPNPTVGASQMVNINQAPYGINQPAGINLQTVADCNRNLPVPYTWYQIAPNYAKKEAREPKEGTDKLILLGIAGVILLSVIAIIIGIAINHNDTDKKASEIFASWLQGITSENENDIGTPVIDFTTYGTETLRGEFCAVGEDGSLYIRTGYGVCRIGKSGIGYTYNDWAAELEPGVEIDSMAVYGDYLYIACGENGIYRVNTARSNTFTKIVDDTVGSFIIAEDSLFYLSLRRANADYGELYITGLNGKGSEPLGDSAREGERVRHALKHMGCADFVYVDGYLYYFDEDDNLKKIHAGGNLRARLVVDRERQKPSFESSGLYENGGILYLPSKGGGIYLYDMEADQLKKVTDASSAPDAPLVFAGDALLYCREDVVDGTSQRIWHQIMDGMDTVYAGRSNGGQLWMQAVGEEELLLFHDLQGFVYMMNYFTTPFSAGVMRVELPIGPIPYDTMPEIEFEEELPGMLLEAETGSRSSELIYEAEDGSYRIFKRQYYFYDTSAAEEIEYQVYGLFCVYEDETGEHVECLAEGEIGQFSVMDGVLYYTMAETEVSSASDYRLYRRALAEGAEAEECLLGIDTGYQRHADFFCYKGKIYYIYYHPIYAELWYEYNMMRCYDPESGEDTLIGERAGTCFTIWNDTIYFGGGEREGLWKMKTDGTGLEQIDLPADCVLLREIQVCPYQDRVYLAVSVSRSDPEDPDLAYTELWLFAEDGSTELKVYEINSNFDLNQHLYYVDGCLYYSADTALKIRVLNLEEYADGGSGIRASSYDTVFCEENFSTFIVTRQFVYVQLYTDKDLIVVYDRMTGEQVEEIDCSGFEN